MRVEISFHREEGDGDKFDGLDGHTIAISSVDRLELNTPVDFRWDRSKGWMSTEFGLLRLEAHGSRPAWNEIEPPDLQIVTDPA